MIVRLLIIAVALVAVSWIVMTVLARRLPPGLPRTPSTHRRMARRTPNPRTPRTRDNIGTDT